MLCCRRRRAASYCTESSRTDAVSRDISGLASVTEIDAEIAAWHAATLRLDPCPICFDEPQEIFSYVEVATHSWSNHDRCDAHGICAPCIQRHVEVKLIDEGIYNVRCPGEGCRYHLVNQDIDKALGASLLKDMAKRVYEKLRNENGSLRLQSVIASAVDDGIESWVWSECQVCPQCYVLTYRAEGCAHLACRCGCHYCFICGGDLNSGQCCCGEFQLYKEPRAFLAAWMCFKNDNHPALGGCGTAVTKVLREQVPMIIALEEGIRAEQAAEEWARQQVQGTQEALLVRSNCESLGAVLWHAGAPVDKPPHFIMDAVDGFEMLLAYSTAHARADEDELHVQSDDAFDCYDDLPKECQYDDVVGYVDDFCSAKAQRRAAHGAPRRLHNEKTWVAGEKLKARAPACARQQKRSLVAGARQSIAATRRLRTVRCTQHQQHRATHDSSW